MRGKGRHDACVLPRAAPMVEVSTLCDVVKNAKQCLIYGRSIQQRHVLFVFAS